MRRHTRTEAEMYGFRWGPVDVIRTATLVRGTGTAYVLIIETDYQRIEVCVSPTGRSVRFFRDGKELRSDDDQGTEERR